MTLASKDSKILIVGGGGTIGSSTALHLARKGYTDVRLLDIYQNPSLNSAGNDNNKGMTRRGSGDNSVPRRGGCGRPTRSLRITLTKWDGST